MPPTIIVTVGMLAAPAPPPPLDPLDPQAVTTRAVAVAAAASATTGILRNMAVLLEISDGDG
jgi:hypothetical protein